MSRLGGSEVSEDTDNGSGGGGGGQVNSVVAGTNITSIDNTDPANPIINAAAGAGETNTASNKGTGVGKVFKQKTASDLELKSIKAGAGISIVNNADDIEVIATGGGGSNSAGRCSRITSENHGTSGVMTFTTEDYDDNGFVTISGTTDRVTIPAGVTRANVSAQITGGNNQTAGVALQLAIIQYDSVDALIGVMAANEVETEDTTPRLSVTGLGIPCASGDYFKAEIFASDVSWNITASSLTIQDVT